MKFELCAILLGSLTVTALDKAAREQLLVRRRRNATQNRVNRRMKRSNKHWSGQEHLDMPGWSNLADKLKGDDGWNGHVNKAGDITVHGQKKQQTQQRSSTAFDVETNSTDVDGGLIQLRKFRQLKTMILFLQENPVFGKYCYYGCWCFVDGSDNMQSGYGKPRDNIDEACMAFSKCYRCLAMDYPTFEETLRYNFDMDEGENGQKSINCNDATGTMKRNLCECDRELAAELASHEDEWNVNYHEKQSDFDRKKECFTPLNQKWEVDQCCGSYPARYPYSSHQGARDCCGSKIYSKEYSQCCSDSGITDANDTC